ncbi:MAG: GGDEF domain-containing protein [Sphingobium sp.]
MSARMRHITIKASNAALLSLAATLSAARVATHFLGGSLEGTGLLLSILGPLVIAGPASAWQCYQHSRLEAAHAELEAAKASLEKAHAELQRTYSQLEEHARHDGLTGILNREGFTSALGQALAGQHGTLFICDADEFKRINDRYGHPVGDEALRSLAQAISTCLEGGDLFGRIGGEEFAIFMPGVHGRQRLRRPNECGVLSQDAGYRTLGNVDSSHYQHRGSRQSAFRRSRCRLARG